MVLLVPKAYNKIKDEGRSEGVDATLEAMREAGIDEETRRRVEDTLARRARRNRKQPNPPGSRIIRAGALLRPARPFP